MDSIKRLVKEDVYVGFCRRAPLTCPGVPSTAGCISDFMSSIISWIKKRWTARASLSSFDLRVCCCQLLATPRPGLQIMRRVTGSGPGSRLQRLPPLYKPKEKWRLLDQADDLDYLDSDIIWRRNYASLNRLTDEVFGRTT